MLNNKYCFANRQDAGERLAVKIQAEPFIKAAAPDEMLVLSIPRGGVVVGHAVAEALACPHEVLIVKRISFPKLKALAIGALAEDSLMVLNRMLSKHPYMQDNYLAQEQRRVRHEIDLDVQKYRRGQPLDVHDKIVVLVDDGIATGETMKAAVLWLMTQDTARRPRKVLIAVPVCSVRAAAEFNHLVRPFICLNVSDRFLILDQFYREFEPVSEEKVLHYLAHRREGVS